MSDGRARTRLVLVAILLLGSAFFLYRGPLRDGGTWPYDFALIYGSARAWLVGLDPYSAEAVRGAWVGAAGTEGRDPMGGRPSAVLLYPPGAFAVLAPVAALPWPVARMVWGALNTVLFAAAIWLVARVAWGEGWKRARGALVFAAAAVWMAPASTNAALGQTAMLGMGLIGAAQWLRVRRAERDEQDVGGSAGSGWLLGAATALKPQMALLFIVYEAGRMRWRAAACGVAGVVALMLAGAARMQIAGVDWWASWRGNLAAFTAGADGDPTRANPLRFHMLNLHYPLHNFTDNRALVSAAVVGVLGALSLAYFIVDLRRGRLRGEGRGELISMCMVSVVTLLLVYHRFYDAVLLLFPLALAVRGVCSRGARARRLHAVTLLLVLPLLVPGAVALWRLGQAGRAPAWLTESWLWELVLMPHQPLMLLALCFWLVMLRWRAGDAAL